MMAWPGGRATYADLAVCNTVPLATGLEPAGYAQVITGIGVKSPLLVAHDPTVGAFIRSAAIPPASIYGDLHLRYQPAWAGDGRIGTRPGGFMLGYGAFGVLRPTHGKLTPQGPGQPYLETP